MRLKVSNVCQLLDKSKYNLPRTESGLTFTAGTDGSIIVNGTCTSSVWANISSFELNPEHTFILIGCPGTNVNDVALYTQDPAADEVRQWEEGRGSLVTGNFYKNKANYLYIRILTGYVCNNLTFKPQLYDLTEMYGAGNEPTTVAQFRQDFPNEMYEYSPVCWKKFRRLKYISNKEPVQLLDKSKYYGSSTAEGVTFTNNGDGTWTVVGTVPDVPANKEYVSKGIIVWDLEFSKKHFIPGHKIVVAGGVSIDSAGKRAVIQWVWGWTGGYDAANSGERTVHTIKQYPEDKLLEWSNYIELRVYAGATVNFTFKPQFFDLTEMYGAGNEPTTVEQFRADFPNDLYDYNLYNYLTLNRGKYIANKEPVQLLDMSKYPATWTEKGVTFTNNGDGTITANGTSTGNYAHYIIVVPRPAIGHKILVFPKTNDNTQDHIYVWASSSDSNSSWVDYLGYGGNIITITGIGFVLKRPYIGIGIHLNVNEGWVMNNHIYKPQLFDLTAMYGAGNEPTTVEQFRADFPNELYDYNPYNAITFR